MASLASSTPQPSPRPSCGPGFSHSLGRSSLFAPVGSGSDLGWASTCSLCTKLRHSLPYDLATHNLAGRSSWNSRCTAERESIVVNAPLTTARLRALRVGQRPAGTVVVLPEAARRAGFAFVVGPLRVSLNPFRVIPCLQEAAAFRRFLEPGDELDHLQTLLLDPPV